MAAIAQRPIQFLHGLVAGTGDLDREKKDEDKELILRNKVVPPRRRATRTASTSPGAFDSADSSEEQDGGSEVRGTSRVGRLYDDYEKLDSLLERVNNLQEEERSIELKIQALRRRKEQVRRKLMNYIRRLVRAGSAISKKQKERRQETAPEGETRSAVQGIPVYEEVFCSVPCPVAEVTTPLRPAVTEAEENQEPEVLTARPLNDEPPVVKIEEANTETSGILIDPLEVEGSTIQNPRSAEPLSNISVQLHESSHSIKEEIPDVDEFEDNLRSAASAWSPSSSESRSPSPEKPKKRCRSNTLKDVIPDITKPRATVALGKSCVKRLQEFLSENKEPTDFFNYSKEKLDRVLVLFFEKIQNDGKNFKTNTFVTYRNALRRVIKENGKGELENCDIKKDEAFKKSNDSYETSFRKLRSEEGGTRRRKPVITDEDMNKIFENFDPDNPSSLLKKVMFDVIYFFRLQGCEGMEFLTVNCFKDSVDAKGKRYIEYDIAGLDEIGGYKAGRMYERGGTLCPYANFKLYLSKRPKTGTNRLFLRPSLHAKKQDTVWYDNKPAGENQIRNLMKNICSEARTSQIYSNVSIKATAASACIYPVLEGKRVTEITGHKRVNTLASYHENVDDEIPGETSKTLVSRKKKQKHD